MGIGSLLPQLCLKAEAHHCPKDGALVEASLQHKAKATAHSGATYVVLLKHRRRLIHTDNIDQIKRGVKQACGKLSRPTSISPPRRAILRRPRRTARFPQSRGPQHARFLRVGVGSRRIGSAGP